MKTALSINLILLVPYLYGQSGSNWLSTPSSDTLQTEYVSSNTIDDTLVQKFFSSIFSLEQVNLSFKDSLKSNVFQSKTFQHHQSQISLGYEYGLLRGYIDPEASSPLQVFNVRGDIGNVINYRILRF